MIDPSSSPIPHIDRFLSYSKQHRFLPRQLILPDDQNSTSIYYIMEGEVKVHSRDDQDREITVAYLSQGEFFGELGLYGAGLENRGAKVTAQTRCLIGELEYKRFLELTRVYPQIMVALDSQMISRLHNTSRKAADMFFLSMPERIGWCLVDLCQLKSAVRTESGYDIKVTRKEIAHIAGCSREAAGRVLKGFESRGMIVSRGRTISIEHSNMDRLVSEAKETSGHKA